MYHDSLQVVLVDTKLLATFKSCSKHLRMQRLLIFDEKRQSSDDGDEGRITDNAITFDPSTAEHQFYQLSGTIQLNLLSKWFSLLASRDLKLSMPDDFVVIAARAMLQLKGNNCSNVLAKTIETTRKDGDNSVTRMLMDLVEYITNFLFADNLQSVSN